MVMAPSTTACSGTELACRDNEFGYLRAIYGVTQSVPGPFTGIVDGQTYWSGTEVSPTLAQAFAFAGIWGSLAKTSSGYALAVRDGDVGAALQGRRPVTPGGTDYQAYYDVGLDVTWLANANLAASNTFGISGINPDGTMDWNKANQWVAAMNATKYLGKTGWRLPITTDIGNNGCDGFPGYNNTDCGYNVNLSSEMPHLWYGTLGNISGFTTAGVQIPGTFGVNFGLVNRGPFANIQTGPGLY